MSQTNSDDSKVNISLQRAIEALLLGDRPIAYHAALARSLHSVSAGIFLSQILYWMPRGHNEDGWIWKTRNEIYRETALTRYEQESARKVLRKAGVMEERLAGVPARMHFRVNLSKLVLLLADQRDQSVDRLPEAVAENSGFQLVENQPTSRRKSSQPVRGKSPSKMDTFQPTNTETTTETTTENKSENKNSNSKHENISPPKLRPPRDSQHTPATTIIPLSEAPANISLPADERFQEQGSLPLLLGERGDEPKAQRNRELASVGDLLTRRRPAVMDRRAPEIDSYTTEDSEGQETNSPVAEDPQGPKLEQPAKRRGRPRKVRTEQLDTTIREFSEELHDAKHTASDIVRARNLLISSGLEEGDFVHYLYQARSITRDRGNIQKHAEGMEPLKNRFPYMMAVLEDLLAKRKGTALDETREVVDFVIQDFTSTLQGDESHVADYQEQAYQLYKSSELDADTFVMRCHQARGELTRRAPKIREREDGTTGVDRMADFLALLDEVLRKTAE